MTEDVFNSLWNRFTENYINLRDWVKKPSFITVFNEEETAIMSGYGINLVIKKPHYETLGLHLSARSKRPRDARPKSVLTLVGRKSTTERTDFSWHQSDSPKTITNRENRKPFCFSI